MPNCSNPCKCLARLYRLLLLRMWGREGVLRLRRYLRLHVEMLPPRLFMSVSPGFETLINFAPQSAVMMPAAEINSAGISAPTGTSPVASPASLTAGVSPTIVTPASASPGTVSGTTTALSVLGSDLLGESVLTYKWVATTKPSGSNPQFSANNTNAAKNSTVTFNQAGSYTFTCTVTNLIGLTASSSVNVTVDQTVSNIAIQAGPPAMADNTSYPFTASATDQFGKPISTAPVFDWSVESGGAGGTISSSGDYSTPGSATGVDTIRANIGGVSATTAVTVTGDGIFNGGVQIGTPAVYGYFSQSAGTYTVAGAGINSGGPDQAEFPYGNASGNAVLIADVTSISGTSVPATAGIMLRQSLDPTSAYISITRNAYSGSSDIGLEYRTTTGGTGVSAALISAPGATWLKIVRSGNSFTAYYGSNGKTWTQLGSTQTLAATTSMLGGLYVSSNPAGTLSEGIFSNVSLNTALAVANPAAASANPVTGTTTNLSTLASGSSGALTYTWSASTLPSGANPHFSTNGTTGSENTTVTFDQAGNYTFACTISDGAGDVVTTDVNVTVDQTLTALAISPESSTVTERATQQFVATASDQFGKAMAVPALTWSVTSRGGTIGGNGLYTAGSSPGSAMVSAASASVSGSANITIPNQPPTVAIAAASSANPVTAASTALSVLGADDGGESNLTYTWSTTGIPPAPVLFSANGTNASKNVTATFTTEGLYNLLVTIIDAQGATVSSSVAVNVYRVAHAPSITNASTLLNTETTSGLVITPSPLDGSAQGYYQIANISGGTVYLSDGTTAVGDGQFITFAQGSTGLKFAPTPSSTANGSFTVQAASTANNSGLVAGPVTATIAVDGPAISVPNLQTIRQNSLQVFATGNANSISASDASAGAGNITVDLSASTGLLSLGSLAGISINGGGDGESTINFSGTLTAVNAALNGLTINYTDNFTGSDELGIEVNDSSKSANALVPISVTPAAHTPTVTNAVTKEEQMTTNGLVITPNPTDAGQTVYFQISNITGGSLFQSDGVTQIVDGDFITAAQGFAGLTFLPAFQSSSPGAFDVQASLTSTANGLGGSIVPATIEVIPPSAPVNQVPAAQTVEENTPLIFSAGAGNAISVSNTDQGIQQITLTAENGTLSLARISGLTLISGTGSDDSSLTFSALPVEIDAALNGLTFTPNSQFTGSATIQMLTTDSQSILLGSPLSDSSDVDIEVTPTPVPPIPPTPPIQPVPQIPALVADSGLSTHANAMETISSVSLSADETGLSSDQITYTVTKVPTEGKLILAGQPLAAGETFTQADIDQGRVVYLASNKSTANDGFSFVVSDTNGSSLPAATFAIRVAATTPTTDVPGIPSGGTTQGGQSSAISGIQGLQGTTTVSVQIATESDVIQQPDTAILADFGTTPIAPASLPPSQGNTARPAAPKSSPAQHTVDAGKPTPSVQATPPVQSGGAPSQQAMAQATFASSSPLWQDLNVMQQKADAQHTLHMRIFAGSATLVSTGMSLVYFIWAVRAGSILSSLLSSMPAWKLVDPLPILEQSSGDDDEDEDGESLESMVDQPRKKAA
jgi:plastocyanin